MSRDGLLGSLEELVLLALARTGEDAYGMVVRRELQEATGRDVSIGAVYSTLDRMGTKGWVHSWEADPSDARRSRARRYFRLTPEGVEELRKARALRRSLARGVDLDGLDVEEA